MYTHLTVTMPDESVWTVPISIIARNRAAHYAHEFGGDIKRSLYEDTLKLFQEDEDEITEWASNQMNWSDFNGHQIKLHDASEFDFEEAWVNCPKGLL